MKRIVIRYLLLIYSVFNRTKWGSKSLKILVYENRRKRCDLIENKIKQGIANHNYDLHFSYSKLDFLLHVASADVVYSYGLSKYAQTSNLKLLYIGQVGDVGIETKEYRVCYAPNYASQYIADYILASIFSFERGLLQNLKLQRKKKWKQEGYFPNIGTKEFRDLKIGILGIGKIGQEVANRLISLGCEVHAYDTNPEAIKLYTNKYSESDWEDILRIVDYLVVSVSNKSNLKLITTKHFEISNRNLCLINISRGGVVDENALVKALRVKLIRGAVLDVFSTEPLPSNHPLWNLENVIITPHIAGHIDLVFNKIADDFISQINKLESANV